MSWLMQNKMLITNGPSWSRNLKTNEFTRSQCKWNHRNLDVDPLQSITSRQIGQRANRSHRFYTTEINRKLSKVTDITNTCIIVATVTARNFFRNLRCSSNSPSSKTTNIRQNTLITKWQSNIPFTKTNLVIVKTEHLYQETHRWRSWLTQIIHDSIKKCT